LLNNLEIKKCLYIVLAILLAMVGLVGLAALGFDIPILRQIVGFIFLSFIPGILILRILKIHNISTVESLVYSVGLSLAFVMFSGVFANFVLPLIGISKPISLLPITATLAIFTLILGGIAYKRDKDFSPSARDCFVEFPRFARDKPLNDREKSKLFSPPFLLLILLPLLAILGALLVSCYQNNILLLIFILVVAAIVGLVAFGKFIPEKAYPLAIVMIAIALLYHTTLSSPFLTGYDIQAEYLYQNFVLQSGYWDLTISGNVNTALSIVMLGPIYSVILNMDAVWIFKVIYPLFFCLVPLALFHTYREQIGSKRAFFSAFFFMAMMVFFTEMISLNRQQIAELFFALVILLMIDRRLTLVQRTTLAIIFTISIIVSHYALGYIFIAFLLVGWFILALISSRPGRSLWQWLTRKFGGLPQSLISERAFPAKIMAVIIGIYLVFALGWYGGIAQGTALNTIKNIGSSQYSLLSTELFQPTPAEPTPAEPTPAEPTPAEPTPAEPTPVSPFIDPTTRESLVLTALGLDFFSVSAQGKGFRVFQLLTELFIVVGFIRLFLKPKCFKFRAEYIALTTVCALILFACIAIPYFSGYLEVERFYHITLFLLSPLCILGGEAIWEGLSRLFKSRSSQLEGKPKPLEQSSSNDMPRSRNNLGYFKFLALAVLIPYLLFNTGFIFEITKSEAYNVVDTPSSEALSSYRRDMKVCNRREHAVNEWLPGVVDEKTLIYADEYARLSRNAILYGRVKSFPSDVKQMPENSYIYLKTWNIEKNEAVFMIVRGEHIRFEHISFDALPELSRLINNKNLIYNNGGAHVLAP